MKINTFVIPIIRSDYIGRMLDSLYAYTPDNFNVIVIDQTGNDLAYNEYHKLAHLWITSHRNLGFSKGHNTGIRLAQTPYITLANDDIQFIDKRWWQGILDTFKMDKNIIAVNPMSPKEGAWGYGLRSDNEDTWVPKEGFVRDPKDKNAVVPVFPNGKAFTLEGMIEGDYKYLLEDHPTWQKDTVCDAIAMWCTVFKKEGLEEIGLFDEQFYPGGGEDYDLNCRAYSCGFPVQREVCDPTLHRRMVGTTKSWVWHHWGSSKDKISGVDPGNKLFASRERWNNNDELWEPKFDVWGHYEENGVRKPLLRTRPVHMDPL